MRDRRYDWLYERQKQPVKQYVLTRFAGELADELRAWPPPDLEWESEGLKARWQAGAAAPPRPEVLRVSLALARLDLRREYQGVEQGLGALGGTAQGEVDRAAAHLLLRLVTERCLGLKEYADGLKLTREDLVGALDQVERALFLVTER